MTMLHFRHFDVRRPLAGVAFASCLLASTAQAAGTGMPWEQPLQQVLDSVQGPVAKILAVIVIIVTGLTLAFGEAKARLDTSMAAYKQTMTVQAQVAENVVSDAQALGGIVARSQGAEGALQVGQATNQLLALVAKQQFQIENMMAAQYRAQAIDQARALQAQSDAHAAAAKFLGSGSAYTPQ